MRSTNRKRAAAALAAGLLLAACGDDDDAAGATEDGSGSSAGTVTISGSSTVAPISSIVADEFNAEGSPADISVDDPGTGDGFALFCAGETDIQDASRPIKDEEAEACAEAGIEYVELEVAFDGISVLTSPANDAVECLTFDDLFALLGPEAEGVTNWQDAAPGLPDAPLDITAPGTESGTYDAFSELVLGDRAEGLRTDYSSQADDNAIIAGIEGSDSSLGFVGFAFAEGAGDSVKEVEVDGGDGCVAPSIETIADGTYPISRSLFIYVNTAAAEENPAVAEYVDFYLGEDALTALVEEAGYVPLPDDRRAATQEAWDAR